MVLCETLWLAWTTHVSESGSAVVPGIEGTLLHMVFTCLFRPGDWSFAELFMRLLLPYPETMRLLPSPFKLYGKEREPVHVSKALRT